ncbi:MAG: S-layer homology domain-containing protein [Oscillospiraceae bacterium]|nr:S-layer homology domain-containing protein [Oscillospiraceae bacterium]
MLSKKIITFIVAIGIVTSSTFATAVLADESVPELPDNAEMTEMPSDMGEMPGGEMPSGDAPSDMGEMPGGDAPSEMGGDMNFTLPFEDVAEDAWYYDVISQAYRQGLVSGMSDTTFAPENSVTGAELLTMLYRADGNEVTDTSDGNWYDTYVAWAQTNSIIKEDNGWEFNPESDLTREQMMVIIYRYMQYKGETLATVSDLSEFTDSADVSEYASEAVKYLVGEGLIQGSDGMLRPLEGLTRAETATILVNALSTFNQQPDGGMQGGMGGDMGGFGGSGSVTQGTSAYTITEDGTYSSETYTSEGDDENALRIDGATVTLDGITVSKTAGSSSNTEDGDFYGMNAALLATDGANVTITNAVVTSSAQNGNGVFSYGEGTVVNISDSTITTTADNSGGIQTTGGGTTYASNLTVNTSGSSAAAIRSDRGGGTVVVDGGTYTSNGYNSPAVYSTADITVSNATLTANNSEALVIEGQNSIALEDCDVSGNMSDTDGTSSDENVHNVMIYQSMSGDAEVGTSSFSMTGGTLTGNNGDMFYITNTHAVVTLSGVTINNEDSDAYLMRICGNSASKGWGTAGANGAQVELTADAQTLEGDIIVDTISTLDMTLTNNSEFTGTINIVDNEQGGTAVDNNAVITIDEGSVWTLTGDCVITSLDNNGTVNYNGYTITLADGTVLSE